MGNLLEHTTKLSKVKDMVAEAIRGQEEMTLAKKRATYDKCFKSQILELPGPKSAIKQDLQA